MGECLKSMRMHPLRNRFHIMLILLFHRVFTASRLDRTSCAVFILTQPEEPVPVYIASVYLSLKMSRSKSIALQVSSTTSNALIFID